ncbi:12616_t:CDS:2 [Funneliformis geosporum]|nr:12616_t:CDS:2 [Funneliformis geosporum]
MYYIKELYKVNEEVLRNAINVNICMILNDLMEPDCEYSMRPTHTPGIPDFTFPVPAHGDNNSRILRSQSKNQSVNQQTTSSQQSSSAFGTSSNIPLKAEKAEFLKSTKKYYTDFEAHIVKLKHLSLEQPDRLETKEILNEEPMIEYRPPFLNGLEFDAFFQKYRIALEVQGAQHRLHSTSWYKDVKKLEDIVNRDRQKRCIC